MTNVPVHCGSSARSRLAAAILSFLAAPAVASAQPADDARAKAQRMFDEASKAIDRKAYDEACPKLEEVLRLQPGKVGAMLALGECYEGAGKTASAQATYENAAKAAASAGDARSAKATQKATQLGPKVPQLVILVAEALKPLQGLTVQHDGAPLEPAAWGKPRRVDPGSHKISVTANGKQPWSRTISVVAGAPVVVSIDALEDMVARGAPAASGAGALPAPAAANDGASGGVPTWAWIAGGVGAVSTAAAIVFLADQGSAQSAFDAECQVADFDQATCDALGARINRDFGLWIGLGTVGVIGLGAATYGIISSRKKPSTPNTVSDERAPAFVLRPPMIAVGPNGASASLRASF